MLNGMNAWREWNLGVEKYFLAFFLYFLCVCILNYQVWMLEGSVKPWSRKLGVESAWTAPCFALPCLPPLVLSSHVSSLREQLRELLPLNMTLLSRVEFGGGWLGGYCCAHAPPEAPAEQDFHWEAVGASRGEGRGEQGGGARGAGCGKPKKPKQLRTIQIFNWFRNFRSVDLWSLTEGRVPTQLRPIQIKNQKQVKLSFGFKASALTWMWNFGCVDMMSLKKRVGENSEKVCCRYLPPPA